MSSIKLNIENFLSNKSKILMTSLVIFLFILLGIYFMFYQEIKFLLYIGFYLVLIFIFMLVTIFLFDYDLLKHKKFNSKFRKQFLIFMLILGIYLVLKSLLENI